MGCSGGEMPMHTHTLVSHPCQCCTQPWATNRSDAMISKTGGSNNGHLMQRYLASACLFALACSNLGE
jgi:hypothetical protein